MSRKPKQVKDPKFIRAYRVGDRVYNGRLGECYIQDVHTFDKVGSGRLIAYTVKDRAGYIRMITHRNCKRIDPKVYRGYGLLTVSSKQSQTIKRG
jgi:hypothetical protein